ncbi:Crp/Fnr family transcriptional regulator [Bradyrhizobium sp. USDA 10063]
MLRLDHTVEARTRNQEGIGAPLRAPHHPWTGEPGCSNANDLVRRLSPQSRSQLLSRCETVRLLPRQMLQERGVELRFAYFIEAGAASLTARAGDCPPVEIHTLGQKDFVGLPLILGMRVSPHRCTVQVAGQALRLPADDIVHLVKTNVEIQKLLLGYVQATLIHSSQLVACNSRHNLNQRLARWLLVTKDRLGSSEIALTHRAMAQALAVRRAGITTAIGEMEQAGMIRRTRGKTVIVDEGRLERASCDCYHVIRSAHDRSLNWPPAIRISHS